MLNLLACRHPGRDPGCGRGACLVWTLLCGAGEESGTPDQIG